MAGRGRIISPDFWSDGNIVRLSPFARLFFIGMWNFAYCDKGHLPDDAWDLKLKILPADDIDPVTLLGELVDNRRVVRGAVGDRTYLAIPTFGVHQKADDPRWTRKCPICTEQTGDKPLPSTTEHGSARQTSSLEVEGERSGLGMEGEARQGRPPRYCPKHPNGTDGGCYACRDARIAQEAWDTEARKPRAPIVRRPKPGDGHNHRPDEHGNCPTCGERA